MCHHINLCVLMRYADLKASSLPVVDEAVDALLPQLPPVLVVVVVISPTENHQAFRLGVADVGDVLQQLLCVATDSLKKEPSPVFVYTHPVALARTARTALGG